MRRILFSFFLLFPCFSAFAQIQWSGQQYTEYSVDKRHDMRFFESWTDVSIKYDRWRLGMRYEIHTPPQLFSQQDEGQGLYQRFLEYRYGGLTMTAGNFYGMLGRGLTMRSFENRQLRWDNNIDGLKFDLKSQYADVMLLGGKMRDLAGKRYESLQGGDIRLKPFRKWHAGSTIMVTQLPGRGDMTAASGYSQLNLKNLKWYGELALLDHPDDAKAFRFNDRHAFYTSANLLIDAFSLSAEFKDYENYSLQEGLIYNNPPTVVREHLFTLLNRHQLVQNANGECGYLLEASYPVIEDGILTLNTNHTWNKNEQDLYREFYGQFEWDYPENWKWIWAAGQQKDLEARYLNFVGSTSWKYDEHYAVKFVAEHQHVKINLTARQFYSQAYALSFSKANRFTVSLLTERTTEQHISKKFWAGLQFDAHIAGQFDVTLFGGTRREGKICAGGICVQKPEFKGVEVTLIARL